MPRIRSIKPSFWTNEELAELSPWHRLCFIGLWNFADRDGRLEDRPRKLKAEIFPFDELDMDTLLTGLTEKGFITRYTADGAGYLAVLQFRKHQRPKSDELVSVIPAPLLENPRGTVVAPRQEREKEKEKGKEEGEGVPADGAAADGAELHRLRATDFMEAWNRLTEPPFPRCRDLTSTRRRHIRVRLTERPLTEWEAVMARIQASKFCRGECPPRREGEQPWVASFDWLIGSPDVAVKVLEGKYDDRGPRVVHHQPGEDWFTECKRLHGGSCGLDRHRHRHQLDMDAAKAKQPA